MDVTKECITFANNFFHNYLTLQDIEQIKMCLMPDIAWVSASTGKIFRGYNEVVAMLENEKRVWGGSLSIQNTHCEAMPLTGELCSVFGELMVEEKNPQEASLVAGIRFMMIGCAHGDQIFLQQMQMFVHDSAPAKDDTLPWPVAKGYCENIREQLEEKTEELRRQNTEFKMLLHNIPGGVIQVLNDQNFTICRMYEGFVKMFGYSEKEIAEQFDNQYINIIYSEDRNWVCEQLQASLSRTSRYEIIYRAKCKNSTLIWILEKGQMITDESGIENFYCVLIDITDTILAQEALQISEERYRIVSEQSNDIIFEINLADKTLGHSPMFEQKFGYVPDITDFPQSILESEMIHPDDLGLANVAYKNLCVGEGRLQSEMRVRKSDGDYIWCSVQMTTIFDINHNPVKIVGKMVDIDEQKKEKERLIEKARRDLLTGLYNKMTTQALIKQCIADSKNHQQHVMMVIDVDNFKGVNDSLGHQIGDAVLREVSIRLQRLFSGTEIVGRIGGDEFIVLLRDVPDLKAAEQKAWEVCKIFHSLSFGSSVTAAISGSVGVSCYPRDGITYTQLFKRADESLYYAKEHGRDRYFVYDANLIIK